LAGVSHDPFVLCCRRDIEVTSQEHATCSIPSSRFPGELRVTARLAMSASGSGYAGIINLGVEVG